MAAEHLERTPTTVATSHSRPLSGAGHRWKNSFELVGYEPGGVSVLAASIPAPGDVAPLSNSACRCVPPPLGGPDPVYCPARTRCRHHTHIESYELTVKRTSCRTLRTLRNFRSTSVAGSSESSAR